MIVRVTIFNGSSSQGAEGDTVIFSGIRAHNMPITNIHIYFLLKRIKYEVLKYTITRNCARSLVDEGKFQRGREMFVAVNSH